MALQAEGAHIRKVALPATFNDRDDMIGIPQAFSTAQVPLGGSAKASGSTETTNVGVSCDAIDAAKRTNAAIPFEHPFPKVTCICAQLPLVDAPIRTERYAATGNLEMTPPAEISPVRTLFELLAVDPTTGHRALHTHKNRIGQECFRVSAR